MKQLREDVLTEPARVAAVRQMLDVAPIAGLDAPCRVAARSVHTPATIAAILDAADVHVVGYGSTRDASDGTLTPWGEGEARERIAAAICPSIVAHGSTMAVPDTRESSEPDIKEAVSDAGVLAYTGAPIRDADGHVLGAFCALEPEPRQWTDDDIALTAEFAALLGSRLDLAATLRDNAVAAAAAEREHSFLEALLESLDVGLVAVDEGGAIVVMNQTLRAFYDAPPGVPLQEWFVQSDIQVYDADGREPLSAAETPLGRALSGERVSGAEIVVMQSGRAPRRVLANVQPIVLADGSRSGAVGTSYDITERRLLEAGREDLLRAQEEHNRELEELDRRKNDFIASIGHELRTPLTVIHGYSGLLASTEEPGGRAHEWATAIERRCEDLQRLLDDFVDLTKFDAGVAVVEWRDVDVDQLVRGVIRDHESSANRSGVTIRESLEAASEVRADSRRLRQVVDNLISNAVKYSESGGMIDVGTTSIDGQVHLVVRDEGIGVAETEIPHLFDRFFRAQTARERDIQGTGLGLAVTSEIVRAHGGTITGLPNQERGMCFTVVLPALADQPGVSSAGTMS